MTSELIVPPVHASLAEVEGSPYYRHYGRLPEVGSEIVVCCTTTPYSATLNGMIVGYLPAEWDAGNGTVRGLVTEARAERRLAVRVKLVVREYEDSH